MLVFFDLFIFNIYCERVCVPRVQKPDTFKRCSYLEGVRENIISNPLFSFEMLFRFVFWCRCGTLKKREGWLLLVLVLTVFPSTWKRLGERGHFFSYTEINLDRGEVLSIVSFAALEVVDVTVWALETEILFGCMFWRSWLELAS